MFSRLTPTILCMAAMLLAVILIMPHTAEAQGYNVATSSPLAKVVYGGNNQEMPRLDFAYSRDGERSIDIEPGGTITISYGGFQITSAVGADDGDALALECGDNFTSLSPCSGSHEAVIKNKDGKGTVVITLGASHGGFRVAGVRVDVSSLKVKDKVTVNITSSDTADSVPVGGSAQTGSVSGDIAEVANALAVTAMQDTGLSCGPNTVTPSITIAEGFGGAWNDTLSASGVPQTLIKVAVKNLPKGDKIDWGGPHEAKLDVDHDSDDDTAKVSRTLGTLTVTSVPGVSTSDGSVVVFSYMIPETNTTDNDTDAQAAINKAKEGAMSFTIKPKVTIKGEANLDIHAILAPHAERNADGTKNAGDLMTNLSFEAPAEYPKDGKGMGWAVVSECVTYLLYPFITCGATPGWGTGLSVSNTSADGDIFGGFGNTKDQSGSVVMYGFPKGQEMPAEDKSVQPIVHMVSSNLMAGDTITINCAETTMAGMEGYAIVKAGFQHARGMAFVMGDFADGATVDVAHGYTAEVIDDPRSRTDTLPETPVQ